MTVSVHDIDDQVEAPIPAASGDTRDQCRAVREFEAVCMKHRLACGEPENLAPFLSALGENKLLAMNFWSTVARLGDGKHGPPLPPHDVLAVIVRAVTGHPVEEVDDSHRPEIDRLTRLLAGEDVALDTSPAFAPRPVAVPSPLSESAVEAEKLVTHESEASPAPAPPSAPPSQVPAGSRLILLPDPPRTLGAAIAAAPEIEEPSVPARVATLSDQRGTANRQFAAATDDEQRISIPLSAYAESSQPSAAPRTAIIVVLLTALGILTVVAARNPDGLQQSAAALWQNSRSLLHLVPASPAPVTPTAVSVPAPAAAPSAEQDPPVPSHSDTPSPSTPAPDHETPRLSSSRHTFDGQDDASDAALVQVSGDEMHDHLISSRFPIVPDSANADAINGVVTLKAVITDRGTVEHIHAISGPDNLRQPAIDAVSGWRYRPYLVDGTPTDVNTTIRVDFSGND